MQNIVGAVARGEDFFERKKFIAHLWERLESGNNILLKAPRRFGKTSVMFRLIDDPFKPDWVVMHLDVESINKPVDFVIAVFDSFISHSHTRSFLAKFKEKSSNWLHELLDTVEISGPLDVSVKAKLKEKIGPHWQDKGEDLLKVLCNYKGKKKLLMIIDELPVMLRLFKDSNVSVADQKSFLYWFRGIRIDSPRGIQNCRFLIGGSVGIDNYLSELRASDSCNDFQRIDLPPLTSTQAIAFLEAIQHTSKLNLSRRTQKKVLELVGEPIPYFIQMFVAETRSAKARGETRLGLKSIERIYEEDILGGACKNYFQYYYDRLRHYNKFEEQAMKTLLKGISLAYPKSVPKDHLFEIFHRSVSKGVDQDDFVRLLADLENDFYIKEISGTGYQFKSKILCDWWRRHYAF